MQKRAWMPNKKALGSGAETGSLVNISIWLPERRVCSLLVVGNEGVGMVVHNVYCDHWSARYLASFGTELLCTLALNPPQGVAGCPISELNTASLLERQSQHLASESNDFDMDPWTLPKELIVGVELVLSR